MIWDLLVLKSTKKGIRECKIRGLIILVELLRQLVSYLQEDLRQVVKQ